MEEVQCAETNEKSIFRFLFFELSWKFIENWGDLSRKMIKSHYNMKNKNLKFDFFFRFHFFHVSLNTYEIKKGFWCMHTHSCKRLKPGIAKYTVVVNLFRLGSTILKKRWIFFSSYNLLKREKAKRYDEPARPDSNALWRLISQKIWEIGTWNFNTIFIQVFNLCYQNLESISFIVLKLSTFSAT